MKAKKLQINLDDFADTREGFEACINLLFNYVKVLLIQRVAVTNSFRDYYSFMKKHCDDSWHLYRRGKLWDSNWKFHIKKETDIIEERYKKFFLQDIIEWISFIDSPTIMKGE